MSDLTLEELTRALATAREDHRRIYGDYERDLTKMTARVQALESELSDVHSQLAQRAIRVPFPPFKRETP